MPEQNNDIFYFDTCKQCHKLMALKNGYCADCKNELPDCFKDIFRNFEDKK